MIKNCDNKKLLSLIQAGDPHVIDAAIRCFGADLVAVARARCRTRSEAEDVLQTALTSATENIKQFRGDGSFAGWLTRMVINACHRSMRGQKNDWSRHDTDVDLMTPSPSPEDDASAKELAEHLARALLRLNARDQLIVLLSGIEGWTAPEIAAELEITPDTARTRLSRARRKLREQLRATNDPRPGSLS